MRRYAILALPRTGKNHTVTCFPRAIIPVCLCGSEITGTQLELRIELAYVGIGLKTGSTDFNIRHVGTRTDADVERVVPIYCLNCTKCGKLVLRKITNNVATRCNLLKLKCTKFDFGYGSAPDPAEGAYSAPPDLLAGVEGPTSKGREGRNAGREGQGNGRGGRTVWEGEGGERDG